ncbi:MAG TPA: helix-turn-helix transcriptional regulator [Vicinamibacterales bacterium]|nr:helix-turn-helix transcriptional regulator [Vicinamibacterales bacterium]
MFEPRGHTPLTRAIVIVLSIGVWVDRSRSRAGTIGTKSASSSGEGVAIQPDLPTDERLQERVRKILEIVRSGRPCSVHSLAVEFDLSESHLQHLFKRQTGLRLGHFLIEQKLQLSAELLRRSNLSIKQIAYAVGYQHTPSFTRAFEHRFAESPWAYRKGSSPTSQKN